MTSGDTGGLPSGRNRPPVKGVYLNGSDGHTLDGPQFASMKPNEFGPTIDPKWQVGERLLKEVKLSVEKTYLTPLDGARLISSITATLFGYDEFILREISPESWLASSPTGASGRLTPEGEGAQRSFPLLSSARARRAGVFRQSVAELGGALLQVSGAQAGVQSGGQKEMTRDDDTALIAGQLAELTQTVEGLEKRLAALLERADSQQERADTQQERIDLAARELAEVSERLQAAANALRQQV